MVNMDSLCMGCMNDNGGEEICPICGFSSVDKNDENYLPIRTRIKSRYVIGKMLSHDGEGATYIGWDKETDSVVTIREFFPIPLSVRGENGKVLIKEGMDYQFNSALVSFLELHRTLQNLTLNAVNEIVEIIEAGGGAYVIGKAPSGMTLKEFLLRNGGTLSWEQARPLFMPLVSAVSALHQKGIVHGGISPETVFVGRDGKLRLSGFSIFALRQSGNIINTQLFPGYAAIEQYTQSETSLLTPATDVYGFAATLFRVLIGSSLLESPERITDEKISIPAEVTETLPKDVLITLANALQITHENRTPTMEDFKLDIAPAVSATTTVIPVVKEPEKPKTEEKKKKSTPTNAVLQNRKYAIISAAVTSGIFLLILIIVLLILNPPKSDPKPNESDSISSSESEQSESIVTETLLTVPDFTRENMTFEEICSAYPNFKFSVLGKKYSDKSIGIVVGQDAAPGSQISRDTVINLSLSLGQEYVALPDLKGYQSDKAIIELFKCGFTYSNIYVYEIEDDSVDYGCVVKTDPVATSSISRDSQITVYISNVRKTETSTPSTDE